jgi:hypothetical protein
MASGHCDTHCLVVLVIILHLIDISMANTSVVTWRFLIKDIQDDIAAYRLKA